MVCNRDNNALEKRHDASVDKIVSLVSDFRLSADENAVEKQDFYAVIKIVNVSKSDDHALA